MPWFDGTNIRLLRTTKPVPPHGSHSILTPGAEVVSFSGLGSDAVAMAVES